MDTIQNLEFVEGEDHLEIINFWGGWLQDQIAEVGTMIDPQDLADEAIDRMYEDWALDFVDPMVIH